jgi:F-type H+-transporting ATPase subunit b
MDLAPHVQTVLLQILNFIVLAVLLYLILFKPVMRSMKARAAERERMEEELAAKTAEVSKLRGELETRLAEVEAEADAIVLAAQQRASDTSAAMLRQARDEVQTILSDAYQESQQLRTQASAAAQSRMVETVLDVSRELMARIVPGEAHDRLVQGLSDRIWEMGRSEMDRVEGFRRSLGDRTPTAHVVTARPLTPEQQGLLARTFTALADRHVDLEVQEDPGLAAGMRVRLADIFIDSSVAGQLEELRQDALEELEGRS